MKLAIIGTGKMGQAIEKMALLQGHEVVLKINEENRESLSNGDLKKADVAIEFTQPAAAVDNLYHCLEAGIPVVCGTTGWHNRIDEVSNQFQQKNGTLFHASNFSVGVNIMFELNKVLAGWMQQHPDYHVSISEIHHTHKLDKPSGTAVTLAQGIIDKNNGTEEWHLSDEQNSNTKSIAIEALREEGIVGDHTVEWKSPIDRISIRHEAFSRDGFASGALLAASWIIGRKGVFTMNDILFPESKR
jgi:4-hydroxy-tetrahydrodipicolinate reductase